MQKITSVVTSVVVAAGALVLSLAAAGTANASGTYTYSYIDRCASVAGQGTDCFELGAYTTATTSQIWINGSVSLSPYLGSVTVTWRGVGGGNGTASLNIGADFNLPYHTGLYERMNIGDLVGICSTNGSNADSGGTHGITGWWNVGVGCRGPA